MNAWLAAAPALLLVIGYLLAPLAAGVALRARLEDLRQELIRQQLKGRLPRRGDDVARLHAAIRELSTDPDGVIAKLRGGQWPGLCAVELAVDLTGALNRNPTGHLTAAEDRPSGPSSSRPARRAQGIRTTGGAASGRGQGVATLDRGLGLSVLTLPGQRRTPARQRQRQPRPGPDAVAGERLLLQQYRERLLQEAERFARQRRATGTASEVIDPVDGAGRGATGGLASPSRRSGVRSSRRLAGRHIHDRSRKGCRLT